MNEVFLGSYTDGDMYLREREILRRSLINNTKISLLNGIVLKCNNCKTTESFFEFVEKSMTIARAIADEQEQELLDHETYLM